MAGSGWLTGGPRHGPQDRWVRVSESNAFRRPLEEDPLRRVGRSLTVRLITGSPPDEGCDVAVGVGRLAAALAQLSVDVDVIRQSPDDRLGRVVAGQPSHAVVHLIYPTLGIGASAAPLSGVIRRPGTVVTMHRLTHARLLQRAMAVALATAAGIVVVGDEAERRRLRRRIPPLRSPWVTVIPPPLAQPLILGTPRSLHAAEYADRPYTVGYFGSLRPEGGLPQFLALAEAMHASDPTARFVVVGGRPTKHRGLIETLQHQYEFLPVRWASGLDQQAASAELSGLDAAYLPSLGGVSERREAVLSVLSHGIPLIAPVAPGASTRLQACVAEAATPEVAYHTLRSLDDRAVHRLSRNGVDFARQRAVERYAEQHLALYHVARCRIVDEVGAQAERPTEHPW